LGPRAAQEKVNAFFVTQSFSPVIYLGFGVWVSGSSWQGQDCVKSLPRVGAEVWTKFGGDWLGGSHVKEGNR